MPDVVTVACCQVLPEVTDPATGAARACAALSAAVDAGADVVVLPELANSGYVFSSMEEVRASAVPAHGDLLAGWAQEAARGDAVVVGGFCEGGEDDRVYNSAAVVDGNGVIAVYRKLHLWNDEATWFTPGSASAPVVETRHGRIGVGICYDIEFPELTRGLALAGADLIALPTNWPYDRLPGDPRSMLHSLTLTTAYLSHVFVAVCDRCGTERGLEFEGGSLIAGPDGAVLGGPVEDRGAHTIYADIDLAAARQKHRGEHNDAFGDRRPARYTESLVNP